METCGDSIPKPKRAFSLFTIQESFPGTIWGMTWGLTVMRIETSSSGSAAGLQVASQPEIFNVLGCIGLRIRRAQDAWDSWTTTTHTWMTRLAADSLWLRNMKANLLVLLRRSKRLSKTMDRVVESTAEGRTSHSVLGTPIFLANTKTQVGTITTCYDSMPPNMPQLDKHFADPRQAPRVPEVFITRMNVRYKRWDPFSGKIITGPTREALVSGMDYFWERGHVKLKRAILWRTMIRASLGPQAQLSVLAISREKPARRSCSRIIRA